MTNESPRQEPREAKKPAEKVNPRPPLWQHRLWPGYHLSPRVHRYVRRAIIVVVGVAVAVAVSLVTIDLGPIVRAQAEQAASSQFDRTVHIGRLSTYILPGRFLIEDLVIEGLNAGDDPFLTSERIEISTSWLALLRGEVLVDEVDMRNWRMVAETFSDGRQSFPQLVRKSAADPGPVQTQVPDQDVESRGCCVTTVQFLRAHDGEFVYRDHTVPWNVTARNIDLTLEKRDAYGGDVSFSGGTLAIKDFEPMTLKMEAAYDLDGAHVTLTHIDLSADGFRSVVTGEVDLLNWPEQTYRIMESDVDLATMKEIFFADDPFAVSGDAHMDGTWHIFDGGRELTADFQIPNWSLNQLAFPQTEGAMVWTDDRFEVLDFTSEFYQGGLELMYSMAPLGGDEPGLATLDTTVTEVDLAALFDALELAALRPHGRASGRNVIRWPVGDFGGHEGEGQMRVVPPEGIAVMTVRGRSTPLGGRAYAAVPFVPDAGYWDFPVGAQVSYSFDREWIEIEPSRVATPATLIEFSGQTAFGERSRIPFQVSSVDWQESDRLMAAVITAFGKPTAEVDVGGQGEFDGVMLGAFSTLRIEAQFTGHDVEAWNVNWGEGTGEIVIEDSYLDVTEATFDRGMSQIHVDGRFSIGFPREDGGEEINARFSLDSFPAQTMRDTFSLEGYEINGPLTGEIRLYGDYGRLFGFGSLTMTEPVAWGEPFDVGTASLRFEGDGVRVDGLEMLKGDGELTGAMFVWWDGTYALNLDGRDLALESISSFHNDRVPLAGLARFAVTGAGAFADPRYEMRGTIADFSVNDEVVGQVTGRVDVRDGVMGIEVEVASTRLAVSGSGRVELSAQNEAEILFRFTNASLDPFVRAYASALPVETSARVSGTLQLYGPLRDVAKLRMDATVEQLELKLYDYAIGNDGPLRLTLDQSVVHVERMDLIGDGTALQLTGQVGLEDESVALSANGEASLALLQGFFPDIRSSGATRLEAEISGTFRQPIIVGEMSVDNGRVRHFSLPHGLDDIAGRLVFEPDGIRFDDLVGVLAGGAIQFGGRLGVTGYEVGELNITARATEMNLRFPEGIRSIVDAELVLAGDVEDALLSGTVNVRDAVWLELFEPSTGLLDFTSEDEGLVLEGDEPAIPLRFDIRILAPSSLRISDNTARIVSSAELTLGGTYDQPQLLGNIEIESGEVFFEGNRYRVTRGSIASSNPAAFDPFFDIEVETDIRVPSQTYRVTLGVSGTMDRLDVELSSDPPLQESEIFALLLGDIRDPQAAEIRALRAQETSRQELFQAGAARLLTSPLSSGVGRVVEESFGVDSFEIAPSFSDPSAQQSSQLIPTARLLIGKRISDRAHITFSRAVSGANQDLIVVLEYDQNDRLSWVLSQNADRTYALDFRVRHAF